MEEQVINVNDWIRTEEEIKVQKTIKVSPSLPEFVIQALTADESEALRKAATSKKRNKAGQIVETSDQNKFIDKMIEMSVVYPPLTNADLQEKLGTIGAPAATLRKMLSAGEYTEILSQIQEVSGFDDDMNDDVEEVKN